MLGSRYALSFAAGFVGTVATLALLGYAVTTLAVKPPPERFRAGSFEFALAPGWWCEREDSEFVCNPPGDPPFAAIAVIAVKERGRDDTLDAYERHLRGTPAVTGEASTAPEIIRVGRRQLGSREWVEALQAGSEVPNYLTYYLGTTTSGLGILVTMSVHKDRVDEFQGQLAAMMETLNTYQR